MVLIECPMCDGPVAVERNDNVRCDACSIELEFAPDRQDEVALAA